MRGRIAAILIVICFGAAACGSTVQQKAGQELIQNQGQGLGQTPGATSPNGVLPGVPNASGPLTGGTGGTGGTSNGSGPTFSGGAPGQVIGVTATTIYVGIEYNVNGDQVNQAFGFGGVSQGDQHAEADAVIKDINAHGGVAGRKLVPIYSAYDSASPQTNAQKQQVECERFTHDHHIFVSFEGGDDNYLACIERTAINIGGGELTGYGVEEFRKFRYFVNVSTLNIDRQMASQVPMLVHQNYFSGWNFVTGQPGTAKPTIAILGFDEPTWNHAIDKVLLPELAKHGIRVPSDHVFRIYAPTGLSDQSTAINELNGAVLKMRNDGVSHVIFMDSNGGLTTLFSNAAYSQRYFPRYGINSAGAVQAFVDAKEIQPQTLNGAEGLGWSPITDLSPSRNQDNGPYSNQARRHCLQVMKAAGQTYSDVNAEALALLFCDKLYFFRQVANSISGPLTRDSFMAAVDRVGYGFQSTSVTKTFFGPAQHDSVITGYDMRFYNNCTCIKYVGSPITIPTWP